MKACLSALAALEASLSSAASDSDDREGKAAFWGAACRWDDAVNKLEPGDDPGQLLRRAARVASRLVPVVSMTSSGWKSDGGAMGGSGGSLPTPGTMRARADIAAAAAKAASGMVTMLKKQPPPVNQALLQQVAAGVVAAALCFRLPAATWEHAWQLEAMVDLAAGLTKLHRGPAVCPASVTSALTKALDTPGMLVALLRSVASRLAVEPISPGWKAVRRLAYYVALQMYCLSRLAQEYGRLVADEHLVRRLLSLVVLPVYLGELETGFEFLGVELWVEMFGAATGFLSSVDIRHHTRSLLAQPALLYTPSTPAAGARCTTLGATILPLALKVLKKVRAAFARDGKVGQTQPADKHYQLQQQRGEGATGSGSVIAAEALLSMALFLPRLLDLLPCTQDIQPKAEQDMHTPAHSSSAGPPSGHEAQAYEAAFFKGLAAVAGALQDLSDSAAVSALVCWAPKGQTFPQGSLEARAELAVYNLIRAVEAFQRWADGTLKTTGANWVPVDAAALCAAAEAIMRLALKLQQGHNATLPGRPSPALRLLGLAQQWLEALAQQLKANRHQGQGAPGSAGQGRRPLTTCQARAALLLAMDAASTAVKLSHVARKMSAAQRQFVFAGSAVVGLCGVLLSTSMSVATLIFDQVHPDYPDSEPEAALLVNLR